MKLPSAFPYAALFTCLAIASGLPGQVIQAQSGEAATVMSVPPIHRTVLVQENSVQENQEDVAQPPRDSAGTPPRAAIPQVPPASPTLGLRPPPRTNPLADFLNRRPRRLNSRLARMPNMFGDFFAADLEFQVEEGAFNAMTDVPLAGGSRRSKISENSRALPTDRTYFMYQHFHNSLTFDGDPGPQTQLADASVDRYTIGLERIVLDGSCSVDIRLPLNSTFDFASPPFGVAGGDLGNVTVALKRLLLLTDAGALSAGLGINIPTGSNVVLALDTTLFTVKNDAVHLLPFIALQTSPTADCFVQGFIQLDLAANGNRILTSDLIGGSPLGGGPKINEQHLMHFDVATGYWLMRDPAAVFTGLAVLLELHYSTTLQDRDFVEIQSPGGPTASFFNRGNRLDPLNLTIAIHAEVSNATTIRVGAIFPLRDGDDQLFDGEVSVQINRRF